MIGHRPVTEFVSRTSPLWRQWRANPDAIDLNEAVRLLTQHPQWLRRPVVVAPAGVVVGYDEAALKAIARQRS
ncbi:Regulatory protein Spx [bacterium HR17]|jgi:arsenate reductase-like glutaredoxin family protein|uniref:Regulatory protein Spx n=1 Tax=Candidatus Fervidibacter japonicus TaxID=2035412 RepID=A0A2H5X911_9BACT|nr:Regulatory protein Spx [bacterium HR17]